MTFLTTRAVIHLILNTQTGVAQLPYVLRGRRPPPETWDEEADIVATLNYSAPPRAVCFGGAFSDDDIEAMRAATKDVRSDAVWLKVDADKPKPNVAEDPVAYGKHMVGRAKDALEKALGDESEEWKGKIMLY